MKVLVTGGAGFIGSHVVDELLRRKHRVTIVDNFCTGRRENVHVDANLVNLDIAQDDLNSLFSAERFDFVIHLAAQTAVPKSLTEPDYDCRVNILGTVNVLEASRKTGVKRVVFASSAAVYGNTDSFPIVETTATKPTSFYGLSKMVAENYLNLYWETFGLEAIVLRFANVYGERQGDSGEGGVVSIFARKLFSNQLISIFGDGGQTRDFIYVKDVAAANCAALTATCSNGTFNISTGTEISVNQLADMMMKIAGKEPEMVYAPARKGDIYRSSLDNTAAIQCLGWQPKTNMLSGLTATYDYLSPKGNLSA